jgi:nitrogen regulatory protein P-II 1
VSAEIIMKRIEAIIQSDKQKNVVDALTKEGVGGVTITRSLGRGAGERPRIGGKHGMEIQYNSVDTIVTVVEDSKVDKIINALANAAYSGTKGDGKIFVSTVDYAIDIFTKEKGDKAL